MLVLDEFQGEFVVITDAAVPISPCNRSQKEFVLPGDGTITGFVEAIGPSIGDTAVDLVLTKLGITVSANNVAHQCYIVASGVTHLWILCWGIRSS